MSNIENYETHFDRIDREKQAQEAEYRRVALEQEHATKRAKYAARESTKKILAWAAGGLVTAATIVALGAFFFTDLWEDPDQRPKVSDSQVEQQREERCVTTGGGWIPKKTFSGTYPDSGMCIYPGRAVEPTEN